jgi:hypothetical protein
MPCSPYVCGTTACKNSCTGDGDCISGDFCNIGACVGKLANGTACNTANQCSSGFCVDGVCCNTACTGQCAACNLGGTTGTCSPVTGAPVGGRAACTGSGVCAGACNGVLATACTYPMVQCSPASCSGGVETQAATCLNGSCQPAMTKACSPYVCGTTACNTMCTGDIDCIAADFCLSMTCVAKLANGAGCSAADQCTSGFCVDTKCCNTACAGQCASCNLGAMAGTCSAVTGAPVGGRTACSGTGVCMGACNGTLTTACTFPTVQCSPPSCSGGTETLAASCSNGTCPTAMTQACTPYICGTTACASPCASDADCIANYYCNGSGSCLPAALVLLAGKMNGGPGYVDATGAAARFYGNAGVAYYGGSIYIADRLNHVIRKMVVATGAVSTLAGTAGMPGSVDGTGAAARFRSPWGLTSDGAGNLYVADTQNDTIRKIAIGTGVVTTFAGTARMYGNTDATGAAARFGNPFSITSDGTNLYVTDTGNNTIRQIVIASAVVTTLAGSLTGLNGYMDATGTAALFDGPIGIATSVGNVYVADSNNVVIRQIVISSGVVTTIAGTAAMGGSADGTGAAARFGYPWDMTTDGTNLYVTDNGNANIRQIVVATAAVTTLAGVAGVTGGADGIGAGAQFSGPQGLTFDGAGNLFVDDAGNNDVRKVVIASRAVTTVASISTTGAVDATGANASFNHEFAAASDGAGNLFIADGGNDTIRKIVLATGAVTTLAGLANVGGSADGTGAAARFSFPSGLAVDSGNLYVADDGNGTVRKVVISSGVVTTVAGNPAMAGSMDGIGSIATFNGIVGLTSDGVGNLYATDVNNCTIRKIVIASGLVSTLAGTAGTCGAMDGTGAAAQFTNSDYGIASDGPGGNLYVADGFNQVIRKIVISSAVVTTFAGTFGMTGSTDGTGAAARFNFPNGISFDGAGNLFVGDYRNSTLRKIVISSGVVTTVAGVAGMRGDALGPLPAVLNCPRGVTAISATDIAIVDDCENAVLRARF